MRSWRGMQRFTKGVVSDSIGVQGALLMARDVMPTKQSGGWRTRGAKPTYQVTSNPAEFGWAAMISGVGSTFSMRGSQRHPERALWFGDGGGGSNDIFATFDGGTLTGSRLDTFARNNAGALLTFPSGISNVYRSGGRSIVFGGEQFVTSPFGALPLRYAGCPHTAGAPGAPYTTGTVSTSAGSSTITGAGTTWTSALLAGYLWINDPATYDRAYRILQVVDADTVIVDRAVPATLAGKTYRISAETWWSVKPGTFGSLGATAPITARSVVQAACATMHQGRPFVANTVELDNQLSVDMLRWGAPVNETDAVHGGNGEWGGAEYFHPAALLPIYPGQGHSEDAAGILATASWGGALYIFKARAIFALRGYVETDGRDVGATVEVVDLDEGLLAVSTISQVDPIVTDEGIYFVGNRGLCLLNRDGIRNLSIETGARDLFNETIPGEPSMLALIDDRIVVQNGEVLANAVTNDDSNTLVFDRRRRVWYTQRTLVTTRPVQMTDGDFAGIPSGEPALLRGYAIDWRGDLDPTLRDTNGVLWVESDQSPQMMLVTHPISVASPGSMNGRVRAVQVRAWLDDFEGLDPVIEPVVLLGEGTEDVPVELIGGVSADETAAGQVEKWYRLPVRIGTPPVDEVRLRFQQIGVSLGCVVYEAGVEHVPVARLR